MQFELVGTSFRPAEAKEIVKAASIGDEYRLERDAENAYDDNAIKVMSDDEHIGFVPKTDNADLAAEMDLNPEVPRTYTVIGRLSTLKLHLELNE